MTKYGTNKDCETAEEFAEHFFDVLEARRNEGWGQKYADKMKLLTKVIEEAMKKATEKKE